MYQWRLMECELGTATGLLKKTGTCNLSLSLKKAQRQILLSAISNRVCEGQMQGFDHFCSPGKEQEHGHNNK